jgi:hypothetical protein
MSDNDIGHVIVLRSEAWVAADKIEYLRGLIGGGCNRNYESDVEWNFITAMFAVLDATEPDEGGRAWLTDAPRRKGEEVTDGENGTLEIFLAILAPDIMGRFEFAVLWERGEVTGVRIDNGVVFEPEVALLMADAEVRAMLRPGEEKGRTGP